VVRLKPNGSYDLSFSTDGRMVIDFGGGSDTARDVVLQPNGKIVVAGDATDGGTRRLAVARVRGS
jgi:predicted amidohydrolase